MFLFRSPFQKFGSLTRMNKFSLFQQKNIYKALPQYFSTENKPEKTVYEQIGGEKAIDAVVDAFYVKVLKSPIVKSFFENIDMEKQRKKQKNFIGFALGGPNNYEGKDMKKAHIKMKLEDKHFDEIVNLLVETLKDFKVPDELIGKVGAKLSPLRSDIVYSKPKPKH